MENANSRIIPVTVIIPVYNKAKYLEQNLKSILSQTCLPEKVIYVDDCSTDSSREILKQFSEKYERVEIIFLDNNRGVSNARNAGADIASTKYITFIDADDYYCNKNKLKNEYRLIEKYAIAGEKICAYSKVKHVDENGKSVLKREPLRREYYQGRIFSKLLTWINFSTVPRDYIIAKDDFIKCEGYDSNRKYFEDLDLLYKLSFFIKFYCTDEYGTAYRDVSNGLSSEKAEVLSRNRNEVMYKHLCRLENGEAKKILGKRKIRLKLYKIRCFMGKIRNKLLSFR